MGNRSSAAGAASVTGVDDPMRLGALRSERGLQGHDFHQSRDCTPRPLVP